MIAHLKYNYSKFDQSKKPGLTIFKQKNRILPRPTTPFKPNMVFMTNES